MVRSPLWVVRSDKLRYSAVSLRWRHRGGGFAFLHSGQCPLSPALFFFCCFFYPWPREQNPVQLRISVSSQCKAPLPRGGTLEVPSMAHWPDAGSHGVSVSAGATPRAAPWPATPGCQTHSRPLAAGCPTASGCLPAPLLLQGGRLRLREEAAGAQTPHFAVSSWPLGASHAPCHARRRSLCPLSATVFVLFSFTSPGRPAGVEQATRHPEK